MFNPLVPSLPTYKIDILGIQETRFVFQSEQKACSGATQLLKSEEDLVLKERY